MFRANVVEYDQVADVKKILKSSIQIQCIFVLLLLSLIHKVRRPSFKLESISSIHPLSMDV